MGGEAAKRPSTAIQCCLFHGFLLLEAPFFDSMFRHTVEGVRNLALLSIVGEKNGGVCVECYDNGNLDVDVSEKPTPQASYSV